METLVATVLIIVIFTMASLVMNTIFSSTIKRNTQPISERLQKLEYEYKNGLIKIPYFEEWETWEIEMIHENISNMDYIVLEATDPKAAKKLKTYTIIN